MTLPVNKLILAVTPPYITELGEGLLMQSVVEYSSNFPESGVCVPVALGILPRNVEATQGHHSISREWTLSVTQSGWEEP